MSSAGRPEAVREPGNSPPTELDPLLVPDPRTDAVSGLRRSSPPPGVAHPSPAGRVNGPGGSPPHRWGLGAYLLVEAVFLVASVLLVLPYVGHPGPPPPTVLLLSLTVPTLLAAGVALLVTRLRGHGPAADLGLCVHRGDLARGLAFGCGGLVLTIPAAAVWSQVVGAERANSAVGQMFAGHRFSVPMAVAVFLMVWLVAPICEEIVYRGLLWGALRRHLASRWWTLGLTTLCFALAHFEFTRTPLLLVIGVPIGLARLYTGRLGASIVAHQLNNLLPAVWLLLVMLGAPP